jgi:hypothetical protein
MDLLVKHFDGLVNLLFGGTFAVAAVLVFVKYGSIFGMVMLLSFGVAFTALGWLALRELIAPEGVRVSFLLGATGIVFIIQRIFYVSSGTKK